MGSKREENGTKKWNFTSPWGQAKGSTSELGLQTGIEEKGGEGAKSRALGYHRVGGVELVYLSNGRSQNI